MVRSLANPSSLSTQRSISSDLCDREEDRGEIFWASVTVTIFSNNSTGDASAVHNNTALFSYITCYKGIAITILESSIFYWWNIAAKWM